MKISLNRALLAKMFRQSRIWVHKHSIAAQEICRTLSQYKHHLPSST